jgi:hypothetical protein
MRLAWLWPVLAICVAAAPWTPPVDGVLTESQLRVYIETTRDWAAQNAEIAAAFSHATTDEERGAILSSLPIKRRACLDRHQISEAEYGWIARQATDAWTVAAAMKESSDADMAGRKRDCERQIAAAEIRIRVYQDALAKGRRVMSPVDWAEAVRAAQSDETAALNQSKELDEEIRIAMHQEARQTADMKEAEGLAANPPEDVDKDERADYCKNKREEAEAAHEAALDAFRDQEIAEQNRNAALERAVAAAQIAADPTLPVTDEDKAAVKARNEAVIKEAQTEIDQCESDLQRDRDSKVRSEEALRDLQRSVSAGNLELMQKHYQDFADLFADGLGG